MDYKQADAIWNGIGVLVGRLEYEKEELSGYQQMLVEQYELAVETGRIDFEEMFQLEKNLRIELNCK